MCLWWHTASFWWCQLPWPWNLFPLWVYPGPLVGEGRAGLCWEQVEACQARGRKHCGVFSAAWEKSNPAKQNSESHTCSPATFPSSASWKGKEGLPCGYPSSGCSKAWGDRMLPQLQEKLCLTWNTTLISSMQGHTSHQKWEHCPRPNTWESSACPSALDLTRLKELIHVIWNSWVSSHCYVHFIDRDTEVKLLTWTPWQLCLLQQATFLEGKRIRIM